MSRIKICVAVLLVAAAAVFVPSRAAATTATVELAIAGSSAMWQTAALAAYTGTSTTQGNCLGLGITTTAPCHHYTTNAKFNLNDTRPTTIGGSTNVDTGTVWIVWDSNTTTRHVWLYISVDSVVGDRCFFAQPRCTISTPGGYAWGTAGNKIPSSLWGADTTPVPPEITALFGTGIAVSAAATDIRPDDAQFAICRVNSLLGNGTGQGASGDGLDGLGYATNPSGTCPAFSTSPTLTNYVGTNIVSGFGTTPATANPLAFNISGRDPFTNTVIPASVVVNFGAAPIVFMFSRSSTANTGLAGATDASDTQLQTIFSGTNCDASVLAGTAGSAPIQAFIREPLSGTGNTAEASVFRRPLKNLGALGTWQALGTSQEANVGATNPLKGTACLAGGTRSRAIGTGEMVGTAIKGAGGATNDGIGYAFFSFGNVASIAASANYGYLTLDGQDPIGLGDPTQQLPLCAYPCPTNSFPTWISGTTLKSFPALRTGKYSAWSLLRMVTISGKSTLVQDLAKASFLYDVNQTSDFIPVSKTTDSLGNVDPGLVQFHTHYRQKDGNGGNLGGAAANGTFTANHNPSLVAADHGGDMGGCTITTTGITGTTKLKYIQTAVADPSGVETCTLDRIP